MKYKEGFKKKDHTTGTFFEGLKATNEWQDTGTGVLHQVAQHPIDQLQYMDIQGAHAIPRGIRYWLHSR